MKPSASKRRSKRTESIEVEEDASLASVSRNNTPSGSSESDAGTTDKRSSKRSSGKKSNDSEGEYSDTEDNKRRSNDKRRSTKKRLYTGKDTEHQDSHSLQRSESDDEIESAKSAKKLKVEKGTLEKKPKRGKGKLGRKVKQADVANGNTVVPDNADYEVEDIIDNRMKFGKLQYLIRWKGYGAQDDTWERADGLQCPDVIKRYKHRVKEDRDAESSGDEKTEEYEVHRILEVHFRRDGSREFLVNWKGFRGKDNTWEHEKNMKCPEIIAQFMRRVEQAKEVTPRELREHRKPTNHFKANTFKVVGRRLSGRSRDKPRVNYFYDDQY